MPRSMFGIALRATPALRRWSGVHACKEAWVPALRRTAPDDASHRRGALYRVRDMKDRKSVF
jgi:hypothetical protein